MEVLRVFTCFRVSDCVQASTLSTQNSEQFNNAKLRAEIPKERSPIMAKRRRCRLVNSEYKDIDLQIFEDLILSIIESTVPGKHPVVCKDHFSTDPLTQGEAISLGRELAKVPALAQYGKTVTSFRLFDGRTYDPDQVKKKKGGRMA